MKLSGDVFRTSQPMPCPECKIPRLAFVQRHGQPPRCLICEAFPYRHSRSQRGFFVILASTALVITALSLYLIPTVFFFVCVVAAVFALWPPLVHKAEPAKPPAPRPVETFKARTTFYARHFEAPPARAIHGHPASALLMPRTCVGCGKDRRIFTEMGICLKCTGEMKTPTGAA